MTSKLVITINIKGFPCGSAGKESAFNEGDLGSIPGLVRSPGEGKGYPLQYSGLENSMDCIIHRVARVRHNKNIIPWYSIGNVKVNFNANSGH